MTEVAHSSVDDLASEVERSRGGGSIALVGRRERESARHLRDEGGRRRSVLLDGDGPRPCWTSMLATGHGRALRGWNGWCARTRATARSDCLTRVASATFATDSLIAATALWGPENLGWV